MAANSPIRKMSAIMSRKHIRTLLFVHTILHRDIQESTVQDEAQAARKARLLRALP